MYANTCSGKSQRYSYLLREGGVVPHCMYRLDLLTVACETSLLNNLTPDNAVETLITIDKLKHISKQEHRLKVLAYIKKEADEVVKSKDWKKFVQNYPDLVTEIVVLKCSKKHGTCSS